MLHFRSAASGEACERREQPSAPGGCGLPAFGRGLAAFFCRCPTQRQLRGPQPPAAEARTSLSLVRPSAGCGSPGPAVRRGRWKV